MNIKLNLEVTGNEDRSVTENIDDSGPALLREKGFEVIEGWT